jgi:hypothetical protein
MARAHLKQAPQPAPVAEAEPPPAPPEAANSSAPPARSDATGVPPITTENPWRYLHPSRIWPD